MLSVIVPIFNSEKYLDRCLESIVNQTYKDFEILLINDGSKDNSLKLCEKWEKTDSRIRLIDQENQGLSVVRNNGVKYSKGEYISFIDSDDYIDKDMFKKIIETMEKEKCDIGICNYKEVRNDSINVKFKKNNSYNIYSKDKALTLLLQGKITDHSWNKIYKKEVFNNIEFPFGKYFQDVGTTYKLIENSNKICYIEDECYAYVLTNDGITRKMTKKSLIDFVDMVDERYNDLINTKSELSDIIKISKMNSIFEIYKYTAKFFNKEILQDTKLVDEYNFLKDNIKKVKLKNFLKNTSFTKKILKSILVNNKNTFYRILKIIYRIKR